MFFVFFFQWNHRRWQRLLFFLLYFSVKAEKWNILKKNKLNRVDRTHFVDPLFRDMLKKCRNSDPQLLIYQDGVSLLGQDCFFEQKENSPISAGADSLSDFCAQLIGTVTRICSASDLEIIFVPLSAEWSGVVIPGAARPQQNKPLLSQKWLIFFPFASIK